jgi:hypothetical protein
MIKPVIQKFKIKHHSQKNSYDEKLDSLFFTLILDLKINYILGELSF